MRRLKLEVLLILAAALLIGQLAWPGVARWWCRPSPGTFGISSFEPNSTLAAQYAAFLPNDYGDRGRTWPLVVFLHGSGERGNDPAMLRGSGPLAIVQHGTPLKAIIVAPQCLPNCQWQPDSVVRFIEHVASAYRVDRKQIYLIGYSMGGYGTWRTAAAHPGLFAAIVPISGGGETNDAKTLAVLPVWAFHGAKDNVIPVVQSERMVEAIRAAGGQPQLTIFPQAGHGICNQVCHRPDLWEWIFRQRRVAGEFVDEEESSARN